MLFEEFHFFFDFFFFAFLPLFLCTRADNCSEDFSLLVTFLLVTFSWLFRGPHLLRKTVFGRFSWLLRGFFRGFFVALVLGKFYAYSPWKSLPDNCNLSKMSGGIVLGTPVCTDPVQNFPNIPTRIKPPT